MFNLKISGQVPEYTNHLRIGVLKDETVLRDILDKGVKTLTAQEREAISNKHVAVNIQQGIDWTRVYVLLALLVLATVIALYILRQNRQLKAALAASQEARSALRVAAIAFESQDGMIVTDAQTVILKVNSAFTQITGYSTQEAIGKTPRLLSSGRHDASFYAAMWEAIQQTGAWHGELWNQRKNGEVYPQQLTITAVKGDAGEVTHYVATLHDITVRKQLENEVAQLAFFDTLTQLPNRRLFNDRLCQALTRAKRDLSTLALMFIDLDKFKPINDAHGHDIGDWVLQTVAKRIKACLRASDTPARVGGDEFLVLLPGIQAIEDAIVVAEKIRLSLEQPYVTPNGLSLTASASIGIAIYPDHAQTEQNLLRAGDLAMYQAKNAGGNAVVYSHSFKQKET